MADLKKGWAWFERDGIGDDAAAYEHDLTLPDPDRELCTAYARCFYSGDGEKVLAHLRQLTQARALGPETTDQALRHVEGQRQLVAYIIAQRDRGRGDR